MSFNRRSSPAERRTGLIFDQALKEEREVLRSGGTITGTPTFGPDGISVNGSTDYISFGADPVFSPGNGVTDKAFSVAGWHKAPSYVVADTIIAKYDNVREWVLNLNNGRIQFQLFDESAGAALNRRFDTPETDNDWHYYVGTYDGSGTVGGLKVYRDGVRVDDTDASTGSYTAMENTAARVQVGRLHNGGAEFFGIGETKDARIWDREIEAKEVVDNFNNSTFLYRNQNTVLDLPMRMKDHDLDNTRTLDISGNANHAALTTPPIKLTDSKGYDFVPDDYMTVSDDPTLSFGDGSSDKPFSISVWIKMDDATNFALISKGVYNVDGEWRLHISGADTVYIWIGDESVDDCYIGRGYTTPLTPYEGQWIHLVGVYDGTGGSTQSASCKLYLNGIRVDDANSEVNPGSYVAMENDLGSDVNIGKYWNLHPDGQMQEVQIFNKELTPTQVADLYITTLNQLNDI